uniref:Mu-like prophage protein gpG n=1 Tax=Candidatus Kentrum sp. UNK TaxID=2126344 RepID=A0A451AMJ9_9GAMM|nr:MAG: Mu-like prophage protein gpG [Candidatus Kentron sp. UNK]VFK72601.1 MAG: Mu-like prophage protein gpG [Candidatus Kentron sp. UNK]
MQFTVDFDLNHLESAMEALCDAIQSPDTIMASIGETLQPANEERHASETGPDGKKWPELSELTKKAKESKDSEDSKRTEENKKPTRILHEKGDMTRSFHYQVQGGELVLGFSDRKAEWHHFGTGTHGPKGKTYTIKPKTKKALAFAGIVRKMVTHSGIPARPLIGFPESDKQLVVDAIEDHLTHLLQRLR